MLVIKDQYLQILQIFIIYWVCWWLQINICKYCKYSNCSWWLLVIYLCCWLHSDFAEVGTGWAVGFFIWKLAQYCHSGAPVKSSIWKQFSKSFGMKKLWRGKVYLLQTLPVWFPFKINTTNLQKKWIMKICRSPSIWILRDVMINILWLRILGSQPHFMRNIPGLSTLRNQLKYNSRSSENRQQDGGNTKGCERQSERG